MGAKDIYINSQFVMKMMKGSMGAGTSLQLLPTTNTHSFNSSLPENQKVSPVMMKSKNFEESTRSSLIKEEWYQKYGFIIGLLRNPQTIIKKDSVRREREKLILKLSTYNMEREWELEKVKKITKFGPEIKSSPNQISPLTTKMKHLDIMCLTLERQIDVLSNVDQVLPVTENIYSGDPDSLDGTSSEIEIMSSDNNGDNASHYTNLNNNRSSNFQVTINGRSPLDALTMLHLERSAHHETRKELNQLKKKYEVFRDEFDSGEGMSRSTSLLFSRLNNGLDEDEMFHKMNNEEETRLRETLYQGTEGDSTNIRINDIPINQLRSRLVQLEKLGITEKLPVETAVQISRLHTALVQLERVRDELTLQNFTLKTKLTELSTRISDNSTYRLDKFNNNTNNTSLIITPNPITEVLSHEENGQNGGLIPNESESNEIITRESTGGQSHQSVSSDELRLKRKSTYKVAHHNNETSVEIKQLRSLINDLHSKELESHRKSSALETEISNVRNKLADEEKNRSEADKTVRILEIQLDEAGKRLEATEQCFLTRDEEYSALKLDLDTLQEENKRLNEDLNLLYHRVEKERSKSSEKLSRIEKEIVSIIDQNRILHEDINRERVLRKRYYNIAEELKGKIRVFCRIRPLGKNEKGNDIVAKCSDPYTVTVETSKGFKEFQFDRVFTHEDTQEQIFSDTRNLIQSAFDGYNVCCVSYGQTGSGKSFTIVGDEGHPGIAPRTFTEIFSLAQDMSPTYETSISFYVLELYNDRLIDLLNPHSNMNPMDSPEINKLEIRRDRTGTVWIYGARVLPAESSYGLEKTFRQALLSRHTASTRMNDRSSRSHLIVGLIIETVSKVNGTVHRGKISLLDLAGSERSGKSGVSADTLREANAINKSLSALGDVINALNTDQPFVPYRNNKLTMLMQDSIGGNAKTIMFVNISSSGYNVDETIVSLTYASRVKQVTNGATRNTESKEVARLRNVISRLKRGENCSVDEDML